MQFCATENGQKSDGVIHIANVERQVDLEREDAEGLLDLDAELLDAEEEDGEEGRRRDRRPVVPGILHGLPEREGQQGHEEGEEARRVPRVHLSWKVRSARDRTIRTFQIRVRSNFWNKFYQTSVKIQYVLLEIWIQNFNINKYI